MIVFAAHVPHTPLLLPTIGKDQRKRLADTLEGMRRLEEDLYAARPETILVISSHSSQHADAFSINLHDEYVVDLKEFGDLTTNRTFAPGVDFIDKLQRALRRAQQPLTLDSDAALDFGSAVPLLTLTLQLPRVRIVPLSYSGLEPKAHHAFGRAMQDALLATDRRIAIISSGDLSHCLSSAAPGGFHREGEAFDDAFVKAVESVSASNLLTLDPAITNAASECASLPILVLLGALDHIRVTSEILSYEAPFGVGYLVAEFHLI